MVIYKIKIIELVWETVHSPYKIIPLHTSLIKRKPPPPPQVRSMLQPPKPMGARPMGPEPRRSFSHQPLPPQPYYSNGGCLKTSF